MELLGTNHLSSGESIILWAYTLIILSIFISLLLHTRVLWPFRVFLSSVVALLIGTSSGLIVVSNESLLVILFIMILQLYRIFGLFRVIKNRVNPEALRNRSMRTELFFSSILLGSILFLLLNLDELFIFSDWLIVLASAQLLLGVVYWSHILESTKLTNIRPSKKGMTDTDAPSVTVAIPARNETSELSSCLTSLLESDYPKLEIIVLDDCSHDRTSEIIKNFAHRGVRFISGKTASDSWLPKNYAYHQLLEESGGKYVLFCGTDVRFGKNAIRKLVQTQVDSEMDMISVLPVRFRKKFDKHFMLQPMRYWRELVIPKITEKSPPVLSTCWMARRSALNKLGGFEAFKKAIRPERYLARLTKRDNKYRFIRATAGYEIESVKNLDAQWETAVRTRYPENHSRPEKVFISSLTQIFLVLGSLLTFLTCFYEGFILASIFSFVASLIFLIIYLSVDKLTNPHSSIWRIFMFPISIVLETVVTNYSMWAYEFSEVTWKGRNICIPVLATTPSLPKLEEEFKREAS